MAKASTPANSIVDKALEKLKAIDEKARKEKEGQLDELREAKAELRTRVNELAKQIEIIDRAISEIKGVAFTPGGGGGGTGTRLKRAQIDGYVQKLPAILSTAKSLGEVGSALGLENTQARTVLKAAGKSVESHGERRSTRYTWKK